MGWWGGGGRGRRTEGYFSPGLCSPLSESETLNSSLPAPRWRGGGSSGGGSRDTLHCGTGEGEGGGAKGEFLRTELLALASSFSRLHTARVHLCMYACAKRVSGLYALYFCAKALQLPAAPRYLAIRSLLYIVICFSRFADTHTPTHRLVSSVFFRVRAFFSRAPASARLACFFSTGSVLSRSVSLFLSLAMDFRER